MKRIIKIIAIFLTLIIVNYNMCFANAIIDQLVLNFGDLTATTAFMLLLPLIFSIGIILFIGCIISIIAKKKNI